MVEFVISKISAYFIRYNTNVLSSGEAGVLEVTPNASWPDIVYYNSYTHTNMGWKIHVVDSFNLHVSSATRNIDPLTTFLQITTFVGLVLTTLR